MKYETETLTRRQEEIYNFLRDHQEHFSTAPTLDELCKMLGVKSRGSLHKHIQALTEAGLIEPAEKRQRGIRLTSYEVNHVDELPFLGRIAAGSPIEAIEIPESIEVPQMLRSNGQCYVLQIRGDSMIDDGIFDGDWVVIEKREQARNGEIVVALIEGREATLKRIEQCPNEVILYPANSTMKPMHFSPEQVQVQGVVVGQMRSYR
ncbi:MAG: transcriptional repressor LexA [Gammaproteobacteria bacterium]|nr:MAG: transcriptional repressor LexA [Gammaproteobacteria bacterium]